MESNNLRFDDTGECMLVVVSGFMEECVSVSVCGVKVDIKAYLMKK